MSNGQKIRIVEMQFEIEYPKFYSPKRQDSMFYAGILDPIALAKYKGREWGLYTFGEVNIYFEDERFYNMSDICDSDVEMMKLDAERKLDVRNNNWYEVRPSEAKNWKYVTYGWGLYDAIFYGVEEFDQGLIDWFLEEEAKIDKLTENERQSNDS